MPSALSSESALPPFFKALADPTRLHLLNLLSEGEVCVCHLAETLALSQPKISRHLAYLKRAGLVQARREGAWMHYRWAEQAHAGRRSLFDALRDWMAKEPKLTRARRQIHQIACR